MSRGGKRWAPRRILEAQNELHDRCRRNGQALAERSAEARTTAEEAPGPGCAGRRRLPAGRGGLARGREQAGGTCERVRPARASGGGIRGRTGRAASAPRARTCLAGQLQADLQVLEEAMAAREGELEAARASLRSAQTRLEALRNTVGRLERRRARRRWSKSGCASGAGPIRTNASGPRPSGRRPTAEVARCERRVTVLGALSAGADRVARGRRTACRASPGRLGGVGGACGGRTGALARSGEDHARLGRGGGRTCSASRTV